MYWWRSLQCGPFCFWYGKNSCSYDIVSLLFLRIAFLVLSRTGFRYVNIHCLLKLFVDVYISLRNILSRYSSSQKRKKPTLTDRHLNNGSNYDPKQKRGIKKTLKEMTMRFCFYFNNFYLICHNIFFLASRWHFAETYSI